MAMVKLKDQFRQELEDTRVTTTELLLEYSHLIPEDPAEIEHHFRRMGRTPQAYNKFMAGISLIHTNRYWRHLPSFIALSNAITYGYVYMPELPLASTESFGWSVIEAVLLCPDHTLNECQFTTDIQRYIEQRSHYESEFPLSMKYFVADESVKNYDSPQLNTWLITRTQDMIRRIITAFKRRGDPINAESLQDYRRRLRFIFRDTANLFDGEFAS